MPELRIAVGQAAATSGTAGNVATACRLVEMAADRAASLLLLPEAFLAGYDPELFAAGLGRAAVDPTGPELAPLREACARRGVAAVVGVCLARRDGVTTPRSSLATTVNSVGYTTKSISGPRSNPISCPVGGSS